MGDAPAPSTGESTEETIQAFTKNFPELMRITNEGILPSERAKLEASQAVSPDYSRLQARLFEELGPMLGATSDKIAANQAKSTAESDLSVLRGPGRDLVRESLNVSREADPEYYATREKVGGRLGDLLDSIDLSGSLSGGEREEMNRAQAQEGARRGTGTSPSQTAALANALQFGQASYNRQNNAKNQLGQAIGLGTAYLPTAQSGVDPFMVATGKSSRPNAGEGKFTGVQSGVGDNAFGAGNNFMNNITSMRQQENDINANRRDWMDKVNEGVTALGSLS